MNNENSVQDDIESIRNAMGLLSERMHIMQKEITKLQEEIKTIQSQSTRNILPSSETNSTESQ